jgi:hypothetical protein
MDGALVVPPMVSAEIDIEVMIPNAELLFASKLTPDSPDTLLALIRSERWGNADIGDDWPDSARAVIRVIVSHAMISANLPTHHTPAKKPDVGGPPQSG